MKLWSYLICLIIGHNKILESKKEGRFTTHYSKCSQCEKKWFAKKLIKAPKIKFKKHSIKMRAQGKKMVIKKIQQEIIIKRPKVNFYAL